MEHIFSENQKWTFSGKDAECKDFSLEITLPMDSASTLLNNNFIPDPYYAQNEKLVKWIADRDWTFSTSFIITPEQYESIKSNKKYCSLDLSWVDTHALLFANGARVGEMSNVFDRYVFVLNSYLKKGKNTIKINVFSILKIANKRAKSLPFPIPSSMGNNNKFADMNVVRKVQCHAGWDWGITLMVSGIYNKPELSIHDPIKLMYLTHEQKFSPNNTSRNGTKIIATAHVKIYESATYLFNFIFDKEQKTKQVYLEKGEHKVSLKFEPQDVKRWYPHGHGSPILYPLSVEVCEQKIAQKIGIREIKWITKKDKIGRSMTLMVNGKKIFCKGANWIPSDAMPSRQREKYTSLLQDAIAANMNMIRVWGGGQYEREEFYQLCDELGILVWQDMMFACSLYPSTSWFCDEVKSELAHQIRRLSPHPSIVIYCGDNEVIGALDWYDISKNNKETYLVNYDRLNQVIGTCVKEYDPTRMFWPSSPCNGDLDYGSGWHDDTKGDMHFWEVWHNSASFEKYYSVRPRFCSEFGFQSFSSIPTIQTFTDETQYNITSPDMEHHQKNQRGNSIILEMFSRYFRIPSNFEQQVYLSQLQQAMAMSLGIEYWRSTMPICMGTLYWQLNDNWPVASWSSIEYTGRWKQLHYFVKQAFQTTLVTARTQDNTLYITAINESNKMNIELRGGIYNFEGTQLVNLSNKYPLKSESSTLLEKININRLNFDVQDSFLYFEYYDNTKKFLGEKFLFLCEPKKCSLPETKIQYSVKEISKNNYTLEVSANKTAFYVWLEQRKDIGLFSENCFTLLPRKKKIINFQARQNITLKDFETHLKIYSL